MIEKLAISAVAIVMLLVSLIANRAKTLKALRIAAKKLLSILPAFLLMVAGVSIALTLIPEQTIIGALGGESRLWGTLAAAGIGSIIFMPGFVAFPLAGILLQKGVAYMVLSAFTTTLMMVGVVTFPIEQRFLGSRVTIMRNLLGLLVALVVALATGVYFGELW